jgi:hypothetical protein
MQVAGETGSSTSPGTPKRCVLHVFEKETRKITNRDL